MWLDVVRSLFFLVFVVFGLLPLGLALLQFCRIRMPAFAHIAVAITWGIVMAALMIYLLIRLHLGPGVLWLCYFGPIAGVWYLWRYFWPVRLPKADPIVCLAVLLASIIPFLLNVTTRMTNQGYAFYGIHGGDTLFHLAIIQRLGLTYPFENPFLAGQPLPNYHFLSDLFISTIFKAFHMPLVWLYVWFYPVLLLILCSILVYWLLHRLTENRMLSALGTIAVTVGSNLYYLAPLISTNATRNPSVFWIDEYATRLVNPQLLISYCVVLSIFLVWRNGTKPTYRLACVLGLICGTLFLLKSFAFILVAGAIGLIVLTDLIKKQFVSTLWLIITVLVGGLLAISALKPGPSYFLFEPLWFVKTMYEASDRLNDVTWELKRQEYLVHHNYPRIIQLYLTGLTVFLIGNLGVRLIGLFAVFQPYTAQNRQIVLALTAISVAGVVLPLLFIQSGAAWNTLQYFFYAIFLMGILTVVVIAKLTAKRPHLGMVLIGLFILLGLPGVVADTRYYWSARNLLLVPNDIVNVTTFLKTAPQGVMIVDPALGELPILTALSGQPSYYVYPLALEALEAQNAQRQNLTEAVFTASQSATLSADSIQYIVGYTNHMPANLNPADRIYQNATISVFEVK